MANESAPVQRGNQTVSFMRAEELIDSAKTLAEGDNGVIQNVIKTATITLPATVVGTTYIIRNAGGAIGSGVPTGARGDGLVTITVAPNASDKIMGNGFTSADNKAAINTLGNVGDELVLVGDGVNGWMVVSAKGTWARAA